MLMVLICRYAGILSAVGIHLADIVQEAQEPAAEELTAKTIPGLMSRLDSLAAAAADQLTAQGFTPDTITVERFLNLRCGPCCCPASTLNVLQ